MGTLQAKAVSRTFGLLSAGALVAVVLGLWLGGGAAPLLLIDPGSLVRFGLPVAKVFVNLGAAIALGSLLVATFVLPSSSPSRGRSLLVASVGAGLWTVAAITTAFFTFLAVYAEPVSLSQRFGEVLWLYLTETDSGRAWLLSIGVAALVTVMTVMVRSYALVAVTGVIAGAGLWPLAEQGHAAGTLNHEIAVSSAFVHGVFAAFWVGGLVTMAVIAVADKPSAEVFHRFLSRYSTVALVSFLVVATSGVANAWIRVGSPEAMLSPYGALVASKAVALVVLASFGVAYRRKLLGRLQEGSRPTGIVTTVITAEIVLMGVATGLASALARTKTPVPQIPATEVAQATPAEILTGRVLPPEFEWWRVATEWRIDLIWVLVVVFGLFFYVAGHLRLMKRGDHWPISRTLSWVFGMLILGISTNSGLALYGTYLFSIHMVTHMLLSMAVPLLLVLSAPVTLASRAIAARKDGSRGAREWILVLVHSKYLAFLGHPLIAAGIFAISLIVFYYSPLFEWALKEHIGHQWMIIHFILTGYLFAQSLVGIDPSPHNPPYPMRLIIVLATMAFHAFFGLSLIYGTGLLAPEWYGAMGREWGLDPLADQQQGGELAWGLGEMPTLLLAILVTYAWSRSDDRASKRQDRQADRDGDQELNAYNAMLQARAAASERPRRG